MIKLIFILLTIIGIDGAFAQNIPIQVGVTARVDTSDAEVRTVLKLWTNYLHSRPDSSYDNPYWNSKEKNRYSGTGLNSDRASWIIYRGVSANKVLSVYRPKVLSIEKEDQKYCIKTLFDGDSLDRKFDSENPPWITIYYAVNEGGKWKLQNAIHSVTQSWVRHKTKYITYIYPADYHLNTELAEKSNRFIDSLVSDYGLFPPEPFDYYLTASIDELGKLYNMDYWLQYSRSMSHWPIRQLCTSEKTEYRPRDFVQMLFKNTQNWFLAEGFATWLAGSGITASTGYKTELRQFANEIKDRVTLSFNDIYSRKYYHKTDNMPLSVSGAFIIDMVYKKNGKEGVKKLLSDKEEDIYSLIAKHTGIPRNDIDFKLIEEMKKYAR